MAKLTIWFGVALILLGAWGFFGTGSEHPTALIPAYFGLALAVSGALANSPDAKKRMLWMHVAVTFGLLGFLGSASRAGVEFRHASGAGDDVGAVADGFGGVGLREVGEGDLVADAGMLVGPVGEGGLAGEERLLLLRESGGGGEGQEGKSFQGGHGVLRWVSLFKRI